MSIKQKAELLYPGYKLYGPYIRKSDGRSYIVKVELSPDGLVLKLARKASVMLARVKLETKLGRLMTDDEEADHINGDASDDRFCNLQVLSTLDHRKKSGKENSLRCKTSTIETCPECGDEFECRPHRLKICNEKGRSPCCSRSCSSSLYGANACTKYTDK